MKKLKKSKLEIGYYSVLKFSLSSSRSLYTYRLLHKGFSLTQYFHKKQYQYFIHKKNSVNLYFSLIRHELADEWVQRFDLAEEWTLKHEPSNLIVLKTKPLYESYIKYSYYTSRVKFFRYL